MRTPHLFRWDVDIVAAARQRSNVLRPFLRLLEALSERGGRGC